MVHKLKTYGHTPEVLVHCNLTQFHMQRGSKVQFSGSFGRTGGVVGRGILSKLTVHSVLRRREASRLALPCPSSFICCPSLYYMFLCFSLCLFLSCILQPVVQPEFGGRGSGVWKPHRGGRGGQTPKSQIFYAQSAADKHILQAVQNIANSIPTYPPKLFEVLQIQ